MTSGDGLIGELVAELASRPRRLVRRLDCHGCADGCWSCRELPSAVAIPATGRWVDITHGPRQAVTVSPMGAPITDVELARPWLRRCMAAAAVEGSRERMASRRIPWERVALGHLDKSPPLWWSGDARTQDLSYVDIRRAYPSIYRHFTADMRWRPDPERPSLGYGGVEFLHVDALPKRTHRAVGGIMRSTTLTVMVRGVPEQRSTLGWSRFLAPDLWGILMDTLHAVAEIAVRSGAILWDTDGGIVPAERAEDVMAQIHERFGLPMRVRASGSGQVWGLKSWRIGETETAQRGARHVAPAHCAVAVVPPRAVALLSDALTGGRR